MKTLYCFVTEQGSVARNSTQEIFAKYLSKGKSLLTPFAFVMIMICWVFNPEAVGQTTLASEGFEATGGGPTLFTVSSTGGTITYSNTYANSGSYGIGYTSSSTYTATLTSPAINTTDYNTIKLSFRDMGLNALDNSDNIKVSVSPDNGSNYYMRLWLRGDGSRSWTYTTGTATASAVYATSSISSASHTITSTTLYGTMEITGLPAVSQLRIKIGITDGTSSSEAWGIDDFSLTGIDNCTSVSISQNPSNTTSVPGSGASFSVVASGTGNLSYQWQENTGSGFTNITAAGSAPTYSGYNSAMLVLSGLVTGNNDYTYRCVVTDANCSRVSPSAILNVLASCNEQEQTFSSSGSFTVPAGVSSITVHAWGGGGGGGGNNTTNDGGGGGGGGAYSSSTLTLTEASYSYTVGAGGSGGNGIDGSVGGDSYFGSTATLLAKGGSGGKRPVSGAGGVGGAGGVAGSCIGTTRHSGGDGESGIDDSDGQGGYGGSSAGTGTNGWSGPTTWVTVTYPTGSTPAGGGDGGNGGEIGSSGSAGSVPGGGGGGSGDKRKNNSQSVSGGAGVSGQIKIVYTVNPQVNKPSDQTVCAGSATPAVTFVSTNGATSYYWTNNNTSIGLAAYGTGNIASFTAVNNGTEAQTATIIVYAATGTCLGTESKSFTITVNARPAITSQPSSNAQVLCTGGTITPLSVTATGTGLSYQWYSNTTASTTGGTLISTATSASYTPSNATAGILYYYCVVSGVCSPAVTSNVSGPVTVNYGTLLWKGGANGDPNNWDRVGNWQISATNSDAPPAPPCECTDVTIPKLGSGNTNYPTIASGAGAICNDITIKDGASLIGSEYLAVKGAATVEKVIDEAGWYWHFLSSPVESQDIWSEFAPTPGGTGYTDWRWPVAGINWDFYYYNPKIENVYPNVPWVNIRKAEESGNFPYNAGTIDDTGPNGTGADAGFGPAKPGFRVGRGYLVAYNSDYSPTTHYFTGALNTGDDYPGTVTGSRFYLVGNPYPSSIDWEHNEWQTSSNPEDNHRNGLECTDGKYDYWVFRDGASGGNYMVGNSGGVYSSGLSKDIPPMQGFFVQANSGGGVFNIVPRVCVHGSQSWVKSAAVQNNVLRLELTTNKNSFRDEVMIDFNSQYSGEGGSYKFGSMYYDAPELWSVKNGNNYTIDRYKEVTSGLAVHISAKCGVAGTYTLTATNIGDFNLSNIVYLEDLKTGNKTDLKAVGSYSFTGNPNDNKDRFRVTFAEIAGADEPVAEKPVYIFSYGNEVYINANSLTAGDCAVYIYDAVGRMVYRGNYVPVAGNHRFTTLATPGAYVVKVISKSGIVTEKIVIP